MPKEPYYKRNRDAILLKQRERYNDPTDSTERLAKLAYYDANREHILQTVRAYQIRKAREQVQAIS
jgi:hypothetical protein